MLNAIKLDGWLIQYCRNHSTNIVPRREIQRNVSPSILRNKNVLDEALKGLVEADHIRLVSNGQHKEIHLNPALLNKEDK